MNSIRMTGYHFFAACSTLLRTPFYYNSVNNPLLSKLERFVAYFFLCLSFVPRRLSIFCNPKPYVHIEGNAKRRAMDNRVSVLTYNILGLHKDHVVKEELRPFIDERFQAIIDVIKQADADVVMLQEVHDLSLQNRLIEHLKDTYSDFWGDIAPRTFVFGSGLMIISRLQGASLECVHPFGDFHYGNDRRVNKAIAYINVPIFNVDRICIGTTHLQSGNEAEAVLVREQQVCDTYDQIDKMKNTPFLLITGGDFNVPRTQLEYKSSSLHSDKRSLLKTLFFVELENFNETEPTQRDLLPGKSYLDSALDHVYVMKRNRQNKVNVTITHQSTFKEKTAPSDHGALKADISWETT